MRELIDLERYPLDRPHAFADLLAADGTVDLPGFLRPGVAERLVRELRRSLANESFTHRRRHNIYFRPAVPGLDPDHPALQPMETVNHTLCGDQLGTSDLVALYEHPPLIEFLAATTGQAALHTMQDPLARLNVMAYREGEALNWHFDRSEFTTTLLLQAPDAGGTFEYRTDLRTDDAPNHDGVAALLQDRDPHKQSLTLTAGTLSIFRGRNTAHRVTPVIGPRERVIAVFSYYDRPGVLFSPEERLGFYGRAA